MIQRQIENCPPERNGTAKVTDYSIFIELFSNDLFVRNIWPAGCECESNSNILHSSSLTSFFDDRNQDDLVVQRMNFKSWRKFPII